MRRNIRRVYAVLALAAVPTQSVPTKLEARGQTTTAATATELHVGGDVSTPLVLTVADLKKMPRKPISVVNPHDKKKETYEGVLLEDLLNRAGVPKATNSEELRWPAMSWPKRRTAIA